MHRHCRLNNSSHARHRPYSGYSTQGCPTISLEIPQTWDWWRGRILRSLSMIRILLADDHTVVRKGLRLLLENQPDFQVIGDAADGREAVELAEQRKPDVIIMDVAMPVLNGIR